jgi:hypothetical protein
MAFCTAKAKEGLLKVFENISDDEKFDFVERKQAEREAIAAVSSGLNLSTSKPNLILT